MTHSEKQLWEQIRAQGRSRFILREGLLRSGLLFALFVTAITLLTTWIFQSPAEPVWKILVKFGFYTLGYGYWMGSTKWSRQEQEFHLKAGDN